MTSIAVLAVLFGIVFSISVNNEKEIILDMKRPKVPRMARQISGTDVLCVPKGTCMAIQGPIIHPRIVTETAHSEAQVSCPGDYEPCSGVPQRTVCGQRYVKNIDVADGPAPYGAHPWQAFIKNTTMYTGSGVLIDNYHVLTAAHKVFNYQETPEDIEVYMGVHNDLAQAQKRVGAAIEVHAEFNSTTLINDIAIIRLNSPIALGYQRNIATACLAEAGTKFVDERCMVAGWGVSAFGANDAPTNAQKQVTIPIVDYDTCRASMEKPDILGEFVDEYLDKKELCAGGEENKDACTQDGGAPLMCEVEGKFMIAGLVIWGKKCAMKDVYGVYVDVSQYIEWISTTVEFLNNE